MKTAFIVTSSIELDPTKNFKGTKHRTIFSTEDRLSQTFKTLQSIAFHDPAADIFFLDSSVSHFPEINNLNLPNPIHYVQLENLNPSLAHIVRTYISKSHCECIMLLEFFKHYKQQLRSYDFITKICARYWFDDTFSTTVFSEENLDKFFLKREMSWSGPHIDFLTPEQLNPDLIVDGVLTGTYTVAHAFGKHKLDQYEALMTVCAHASTEHSKYFHQDVEYTMYHFMRVFNLLKDVITVPWDIHGQCGVTGKWMKY